MSDPRNEGGGEPLSPGDDLPDDSEEFDLAEDFAEDEDAEAPPPADDQLAEPEPERRQRNRASDTIRNLRERAQKAEAERDVYRNLQQPQPQPRTPQPDPQAEQQRRALEYQRISMLPPEEQVAALDRMNEQRVQQQVALARLEAFDMNDRSNYQSLQARIPAAARLATQVEQTLQAQRAQGVYNFSREQIFKYLLGEEMMSRATQGGERQRRQGQARVQRQTVRPGGSRGDVATGSNRSRGDDADRRLLQSINLKDV